MQKMLELTDLLQYLLSYNRVGFNFACTPTISDDSNISPLSLLIDSINKIIGTKNPRSFINTKYLSLITANPIVSNRNWLLTRLAVATKPIETLPSLVALMAMELSQVGANRIIVRIKKNEGLDELLKKSGFKRSHTESLFEGKPITLDQIEVEVKKKSDNDDLAIYRLYNQTTPLEVRSLLCPTLSDWQDLNWQYKNIAHEYTIVENLDIKAHLKTYRSKRTQIVTLMANPEYNYNILKHLLQFSLTVLNEIDGVKVFIPDFQVSAHTAALEIDLCKSTSYDIYVLPITATQKLAAEETAVGFVT